jgi:hypothetical protein
MTGIQAATAARTVNKHVEARAQERERENDGGQEDAAGE